MITQADQDQPTIDGRRLATWDDIKRLGQTVNDLMAENEALTADLATAQQTAARLTLENSELAIAVVQVSQTAARLEVENAHLRAALEKKS